LAMSALPAISKARQVLPPLPPPAVVAPIQMALRWPLRSGDRVSRESLRLVGSPQEAGFVGFGDVMVPRQRFTSSPLVPMLSEQEREELYSSPDSVRILEWMTKKASLGQDMALLGGFCAHTRRLAHAFCEMLGLEAEYLALSRDTVDADLIEQVELVADVCDGAISTMRRAAAPIRAARAGRVLILQGLERAEPNTLSVLNNLLENREVPLESGLLRRGGDPTAGLAVSEDFIVIALCVQTSTELISRCGLSPLDPPMRSRLAARVAAPPSPLAGSLDAVLRTSLEVLRGCLGDNFPSSAALRSAVAEVTSFPGLTAAAAVGATWPYSLILAPNVAAEVDQALLGGRALDAAKPESYMLVGAGCAEKGWMALTFGIGSGDKQVTLMGRCGSGTTAAGRLVDHAKAQEPLVAALRDHCLGRDVLLVGERGCGKSTLVRRFASLLGYRCRAVFCTAETDVRDLGLRRVIRPGGATAYDATPALEAAISGDILLLDGLDRLQPGLLHSALGQLLQDRTVSLSDGRTLVSPAHWESLIAAGRVEQELRDSGFAPVHPSFRVLATADSRDIARWLEPSLLELFGAVRAMPWVPVREPRRALSLRPDDADALLRLNEQLRDIAARDPQDFAPYVLSWRQLLAVSARVRSGSDIASAVRCCFAARLRFAPRPLRDTVERLVTEAVTEIRKASDVAPSHRQGAPSEKEVTVVPRRQLDGAAIKDVATDRLGAAFVGVPEHLELLSGMRAEWDIGRHLLLIGPQGVGKNRLADRFCELLGRRREYVELHRDSNLATLTCAPILKDGIIGYQDSALLRAAVSGSVLLVDEVDKAPVEVACVLRELADELCELQLPDGRCLRHAAASGVTGDPVIHADFRMILLANPPGHPFVGHDFFRECGDAFSGFAVEGLDVESECALVRSSAPRIPTAALQTLLRVSAAFRRAHEEGKIKYPYSTREVLQTARHLDMFPDDSLRAALENVLAFDTFDVAAWPVLRGILEAILGEPLNVAAYPFALRVALHMSTASIGGTASVSVGGVGVCGNRQPFRKGQKPSSAPVANPSDRGEVSREEVERDLELLSTGPGQSEWGDTVAGYEALRERMHGEIAQLRELLEKRRTRDRVWLRRRCAGPELDDGALVEVVCGEANVFRRRGAPPPGAARPRGSRRKLLRFCVDVSSSMFTFNGMDSRLERLLEAVVLLVEALVGFEEKYRWSLCGHNGDTPDVPFVAWGAPPASMEDRAALLAKITGTATTCGSGDFTLKATERAIRECAQGDADERFVFVISDANLARYRIDPADLGRIMLTRSNVRTYVLFVADEGDLALAKLPAGRAFVCRDTRRLVGAFKDVFASGVGLEQE